MVLLDDVVNGGNLVTGLAIGVGALIAWPLISLIARPFSLTGLSDENARVNTRGCCPSRIAWVIPGAR